MGPNLQFDFCLRHTLTFYFITADGTERLGKFCNDFECGLCQRLFQGLLTRRTDGCEAHSVS